MEHIADPYAALPSLHLGWGMWVGMVIFTQVRSRLRYVGLVYPIVTIFAVMITGTHFFLDTIAGCALFAVVFTVVAAAYSWRARRSFAAEPVESFGDRDAPSAERIPA
jgi:hypothetical protein